MPEDQMYRIIGEAFRKRAGMVSSVTGANETLEDEYLIDPNEEEGGAVFDWPMSSGTSSLPNVCFIDAGKSGGALHSRFVMPIETLLVAGHRDTNMVYDWAQAILEVNRTSANLRCINWKELPKLSGLLTATLFSSAKNESSGTEALTRLIDVTSSRPATLESHLLYLLTASSLPYAKELASRIQQISDDLKEDEDESIALAVQPVARLISFLESSPGIARPMLATSPLGHLMAKWTWTGGRLSIHFFPDGRAEYFLSTPNPVHSDRQDFDSSITTADALGVKLNRQDVFRYMKV